MKKRVIGIGLITALLMMVFPSSAGAAAIASGKCGDSASWTLDGNGTLTISGSGNIDYDIGLEYPYFFEDVESDTQQEIKKLVIKEGITGIGMFAFSNLQRMTSVSLPKSLKTIGESAFSLCPSLTSVNIPAGVTEIGGGAFSTYSGNLNISVDKNNANYLSDGGVLFSKDKKTLVAYAKDEIVSDYTVPNGVESIADDAFDGCVSLTSVTLPESLKSIGSGAFGICHSLTDIKIPAGVEQIGSTAFVGCRSLSISVDGNNKNYSSLDGVLFNKDKTVLLAYAKDEIVSDYTIPSSVEVVGAYAFHFCRSLTSVELPKSVTELGMYSFATCTNLNSISIPYTLEVIGRGAFRDCSKSLSIYFDGSWAEWDKIAIDDYGNDVDVVVNPLPYTVKSFTVGDNTVHAELRKENNATGGIVVAVSYASNRKIIDTAFEETDKMNLFGYIDLNLNTEGAKEVRVFVWDGIDSIKPLSHVLKKSYN